MSLGISYMGTKRHLVPNLAAVISSCRAGAFLDLFSGMCSVGSAVSEHRQVWSNDLQSFAQLVARTHFCSVDEPLPRSKVLASSSAARRKKFDQLSQRYSAKVREEQQAIENADVTALADVFDRSIQAANAESSGDTGEYDLFSSRYAGTYFGYQQAIEIDSIRYGIDEMVSEGKATVDQSQMLTVALCIALSRCSNSTGHFAQALYPKTSNVRKVTNKRQRSVAAAWLDALENVVPRGEKGWREKNYSFGAEACELLSSIRQRASKPAVVYADPPYTKDQYSRYYHVYETAVLYDYPECTGTGLYRADRASSPFSLATKVEGAMNSLISGVAALDSSLVLSYPTNGLLDNSTEVIPEMFKKHFGEYPEQFEVSHLHSTMGGSKGASAQEVTEVIYRMAV